MFIKLYYKILHWLHIVNRSQYKQKTLRYSKEYKLVANSSFFDAFWYQQAYGLPAGTNTVLHYMEKGAHIGYEPGPCFNSLRHWAAFPHMDDGKTNPLLHWEKLRKKGACPLTIQGDGYYKKLEPAQDYPTDNCKGTILLISHELSHTGAPIILLEAGKMLLRMGYRVEILSPTEGTLQEGYLKTGIPVHITNTYLEKLPVKADCCICNTVVMYRFFARWHQEVPTIWWLHETLYEPITHFLIKKALQTAPGLYVPSALARHYALTYNDRVSIMPQPVTDEGSPIMHSRKGKWHIAIIGTLCHLKAQHIFIEAIRLLESGIREKAQFDIIGTKADPQYANQLKALARDIPEITFKEPILNRHEYTHYIRTLDAICCISYMDTLPTVVIEGLMHSKICIVSDKVGQASFITHGTNGFIVPAGDSQALARTLSELICMPDQQALAMQQAARKLFGHEYHPERCSKAWHELIERYTGHIHPSHE